MTCNHQLVCEYEEEKRQKLVHFPDDNKFSITALKKIQNQENKFINEAVKMMKKLKFNKEIDGKSDSSLILLEGVNLNEFKNKKTNIKKKEKYNLIQKTNL